MPIYEYDCPTCGDFTALCKMDARNEPCACPICAVASPRVILTAPGLSTLASNTRKGIEINERASHAPKTLDQFRDSRRHAPGCSCCGPNKPLTPSKANPHALKAKPAGRPWMISH